MKKNLLKSLLLSSAVFTTFGTSVVLAETSAMTTQDSELVAEVSPTEVTSTQSDNTEAVEAESIEVTPEDYASNVADFKKVGIEDVRQAFTEDNLEHTLYFGRSTCYYCRQFSPELKKFNQLINNQLEYYDTDREDFDDAAKEFVFKTIGIPGTPTVLYLKNGKLVSGWVGGGVTPQQLYDYLYLGKSPEQPNEDKDKNEEPVPNESNKNTEETVEVTDTDKKGEEHVLLEETLVSDKFTTSNSHQNVTKNQGIQIVEPTFLDVGISSREVMESIKETSVDKVETQGSSSQLIPLSNTSLETTKKGNLPKTGEQHSDKFLRLGVVFCLSLILIRMKYLKGKLSLLKSKR
ncbi:thioredoxin family protein [Streptococcus merionis]|uniref:thioredoxin family protein n=1 Tax=Streptococcus merionis TaxID=400065 RepID=UPI003512CD1D